MGAGDGAISLHGCIYSDGQENAPNLSLSNVQHVSFIWVTASSTLDAALAAIVGGNGLRLRPWMLPILKAAQCGRKQAPLSLIDVKKRKD